VAANRVTVQAITDLWEAGETVEDIAYDYDMTPEQVDALCQAVVHLVAWVLPRPESRSSCGASARATAPAYEPYGVNLSAQYESSPVPPASWVSSKATSTSG
ncbi:MAG TPA: DUF433 domain-containing protein, partial [Streptomyces sp.]|nr:DUF433 domain-containing protein [Streptomyces sp.]